MADSRYLRVPEKSKMEKAGTLQSYAELVDFFSAVSEFCGAFHLQGAKRKKHNLFALIEPVVVILKIGGGNEISLSFKQNITGMFGAMEILEAICEDDKFRFVLGVRLSTVESFFLLVEQVQGQQLFEVYTRHAPTTLEVLAQYKKWVHHYFMARQVQVA